jgi:multicomponent Na+:H+ antiporter subunit D
MLPFYQNFPFFSIILAMLASIASPLFRRTRSAYLMTVITTAILLVLSVAVAICTLESGTSFTYALGHFPAPWGNELRAGVLEGMMAACFSGVMLLSLLGGYQDFDDDILRGKQGIYFLMLNLLTSTLMVLVYTNDLFTGYVFLEISAIACCALVMARQTGMAIVCTIRYMIFNCLGSGLFLLGLAILYRCTGHLLMSNLHAKILEYAGSGTYIFPMIASFGLMTIGLAAKSGQFPFHSWLPGAHSNATTTSSAILSGLVLKGYIIFQIKLIIRVFSLDVVVRWHLAEMLFVFGILGMIIASVRAVQEEEAKRMIAFSTVAQIGYIYAAMGMSTLIGISAACFQVMAHAFTKTMLFTSMGSLMDASNHARNLHDLRGAARRSPLAGVAFTVGALSLCGFPLLAGFGAKYLIAEAAFHSPLYLMITLLGLAVSALLNAMYYIPAVVTLWMPTKERFTPVASDLSRRIALVLFIVVNVALGVFFLPIMDLLSVGIVLL